MKQKFTWQSFFAFLTGPIMKVIAILVLFFLGVWLYRNATKQFSPEVQRIKIEKEYWDECDWIEIQSSLFHQKIASMKDAGGGQYFDFQARIRPSKINSNAVIAPESILNKYERISKITISSSGRNFECLDYKDDDWHDNDESYLVSDALKFTKISNHSYALESLSNSDVKLIDIAIKGDDIFCESYSRNPYIAFHIDFSDIRLSKDGQGYLSFDYVRDTLNLSDKPYSSPLSIINIYPEPDYVSPTRFYYKESFNSVLDNGVYVIAEDLSKKRKQDVRSFMSSVLLGVVISFIVQLIIALVNFTANTIKRNK